MSPMIWLWLSVGVGVAVTSLLVKRLNLKKVPDLGDSAFVNLYRQGFAGDADAVIRERKFIAKVLGFPYQKLRPNQDFRELSKLAGFDTSYEVGMSDLEDELIELTQRAGINRPPEFPGTVGELISALVTARKILAEKDRER